MPMIEMHGVSKWYDDFPVLSECSTSVEKGRSRASRSARGIGPPDPLVSMGGVCAWANPEPLADVMDWFFLGEGEESGPEAFALWQEVQRAERDAATARAEFFRALVKVEGLYVPRFYSVHYHADGTVADVISQDGAPLPVRNRRLLSADEHDTASVIRTPDTEFGGMGLLEVGKGCGRGCRFCMEGEIYRPVRHRHIPAILRAAEAAMRQVPGHGLRDLLLLEDLGRSEPVVRVCLHESSPVRGPAGAPAPSVSRIAPWQSKTGTAAPLGVRCWPSP